MVATASGSPNISSSNLCDFTNVAVDAREFSCGDVSRACCGSLLSVGVSAFEKIEARKNQAEFRMRSRERSAATIRADNESFVSNAKGPVQENIRSEVQKLKLGDFRKSKIPHFHCRDHHLKRLFAGR